MALGLNLASSVRKESRGERRPQHPAPREGFPALPDQQEEGFSGCLGGSGSEWQEPSQC